MSTMKIKKGDTVKVIAGKDKDKEGKVIAVDKKDGTVLLKASTCLQSTQNHCCKSEWRNHSSGRLHRHPTLCMFTKEKLQE